MGHFFILVWRGAEGNSDLGHAFQNGSNAWQSLVGSDPGGGHGSENKGTDRRDEERTSLGI